MASRRGSRHAEAPLTMRIDAIIQSFGYADMLSITLPLVKGHFDTLTVWTKPGDEATKAICAREGVGCIETDLFTKGGSSFNRGAAFNEAFWRLIYGYLAKKEMPQWVCILDSDIVLPPTFRSSLNEMAAKGELDPECFYGARRYNVETQEQWEKVKDWNTEELAKCTLYRGYGYSYLSLNHFCSSTFLRLWHETGGNPYPEWKDGSTADWMYRANWGDHPWDPPTQPPDHALDHTVPEPCDPPTGLLRKLPFNTIHIGVTGINATGRHTPLWTTSTP